MTESYTVNIESAPLAAKVTPDVLDAYVSALFAIAGLRARCRAPTWQSTPSDSRLRSTLRRLTTRS